MRFFQAVRKKVETITNTKVYKKKRLPTGVDVMQDIENTFKNYKIDVFFDVGANIGQTALPFLNRFKSGTVYCFEPSLETFNLLKSNLKNNKRVIFNHLALGSATGPKQIQSSEFSDRNKIVEANKNTEASSTHLEVVQMISLDDYCKNNGVKKINYLKIDTEGYDLDVIKSASGMLGQSSIDFIEAEAGMNKHNDLHVPFEEIKAYMETNNYYLFGVYEQVREWKLKKPYLRRSDIVFISESMIKQRH